LRENIFKILFKVEFNDIYEMDEQIDFSLDEIENLSEKDKDYITGKTEKIINLIGDIDAIISEICTGWNIGRIGKAELAILRLAVYEIKYDEDIPLNVAVSEAVELAGIYCGQDAGSFVNGVLTKLND
ncbi:MAG: transcription antitermination factor NusB, partial [Lachnospiraceae bacterium]|nr:transcription antitermination factor NusB [Lachnospiraceae bacterium]